MHCPTDFRTLIDLADACASAGWEKGYSLDLSGMTPAEWSEGDLSNDPIFWSMVWTEWYFDRFIQVYGSHLHVCASDGRLFRIAYSVAARSSGDKLDFHPSNGFDEARAYFLGLDSRYVFLDSERSVVRKEGRLDEHQSNVWKLLRQFEGWSVCFPSEILSKAIADWDKLDFNLEGQSEAGGAVGRPRKVERVGRAYRVLFPDGHERAGMTQKQALQMVSEKLMDPSLSLATLLRALGKKQ